MDRKITSLTPQNTYVNAYIEIDTGTGSYKQSIATAVSSVVAAYTLADATQNTSLGLNSNGSLPTVSGTNYLNSMVSHLDGLELLDSEIYDLSTNIGTQLYTNNYVVIDSESITDSIDKLDSGLQDAFTSINAISVEAANVGATRLTFTITPVKLKSILQSGNAEAIIDLSTTAGAGSKYVMVHDVMVFVNYNTTGHSIVNSDLCLSYGSTYGVASVIATIPEVTLETTADGYMKPAISGATLMAKDPRNASIYLVADSISTVTEGDTVFYLSLLYSIIDIDTSISTPASTE
ncbi:MAG: hypothetical protein EOL88_06385 [Bacteroidia bacterium]|nr:hypothetical protein [Bacteroidia bacterium]